MISRELILEKRDSIIELGRLHGASHIRLFGSVARGESTENSDVDLIVKFEPDRSLFDHGALIVELEELLGVKVDVISEGGMRDRFRDHVAREAVEL